MRSLFVGRQVCIAILVGLWGGVVFAGPLSAGNLVVVRVGDGVQTLANTGNSVFLDEYTVIGALAGTTTIPDSGTNALIMSGSAGSEGVLSRSGDRTSVWFAGYNVNRPFASSLAAAAATVAPRAIGKVDQSGTYTQAVSSTTAYGGNNLRAAVSDDGTNIWGAGGASGTVLLPGTTIQSSSTNTRAISIYNGNLYFSTQSGTGGIYGFTGGGTPTAAATPTLIIGTLTGNPNEFAFNSAGTICYIADDRTSANGGIQRWDLTAGIWTLSYTLGSGAANIGARGLEVDFSGVSPIIYATSAEATNNRIISITDAGAGSLATTLATAGTNTLFRGLEFTPVPEPGSLGVVLVGGFIMACSRRGRCVERTAAMR